MLPAVSADLPVYVAGPQRPPDSRRTSTDESAFGPPVQVELSADEALEAQSQTPGTGLYGPDGRFVESSSRRELPSEGVDCRERELGLAEFDAIIPPAAREELRALADRVEQAVVDRQTEPRQLKQIARLMDKVGRYDEAKRALAEAEELEGVTQRDLQGESRSQEVEAPSNAAAAEQQE